MARAAWLLVFLLVLTSIVLAQSNSASEAVVTVLLANETASQPVGTGLVVRADGYVLTTYSLVKNARNVQVKLANGEIYDDAQIAAFDERRNVALLRINAVGLKIIPNGLSEETQVGSRVVLIANPDGHAVQSDGTLRSVQMADDVAGAGKGYRVLDTDAISGLNATGGLLLDDSGRSLGIVTTTPDVKGRNIAVPLSSVLGMIRSAQNPQPLAGVTPVSARPSITPVPIAQSSVQMPERAVIPPSPAGPGSVIVKPTTPRDVLASSKTVYVRSNSVSFKSGQLVNALMKQTDFPAFGLTFVDDPQLADLIIEIDHVVFTWKYTFKIYSQRLSVVVATGDRIIWDGNVGADAMAERVVEKLRATRGPVQAPTTPVDSKKDAEKKKTT
jgi:hypothetical protein